MFSSIQQYSFNLCFKPEFYYEGKKSWNLITKDYSRRLFFLINTGIYKQMCFLNVFLYFGSLRWCAWIIFVYFLLSISALGCHAQSIYYRITFTHLRINKSWERLNLVKSVLSFCLQIVDYISKQLCFAKYLQLESKWIFIWYDLHWDRKCIDDLFCFLALWMVSWWYLVESGGLAAVLLIVEYGCQ